MSYKGDLVFHHITNSNFTLCNDDRNLLVEMELTLPKKFPLSNSCA